MIPLERMVTPTPDRATSPPSLPFVRVKFLLLSPRSLELVAAVMVPTSVFVRSPVARSLHASLMAA